MTGEFVNSSVELISSRALSGGGFCGRSGGSYRPDATAWAVLALKAAGARKDLVQSARSRLAADQMKDGRVSISPDSPQAFWPTFLAVMAWHDSTEHVELKKRAVEFLLATTGNHFEKKEDSVTGHDPSIRGWPWIEDTHSWVEPTSLALLALELTDHGEHERAREARRMLLDRQLAQGGWNYGNTSVFGRRLRPMPLSTGLALNALARRVPRQTVEKSLSYLKDKADRLFTPLSLGWSLLAFGAWAEPLGHAENSLLRCFERQAFYGPYETQQLSLLVVCLLAKRGLVSLMA